MKFIKLDKTDSTNNWIKAHIEELDSPCAVFAVSQTQGRGQRGNSWESEPGKNLTISFLFYPEGVKATEQFPVSEAVALGVCDFIEDKGVKAKVKWPNDVYVGDRKISGILIENSVLGDKLKSMIAGIGINLNQENFLSDAPNPVSLTQLTGETYDIEESALLLGKKIQYRIEAIGGNPDALHEEYIKRLWRNDHGIYPFNDRKENERINASIESVEKSGVLTLRKEDGILRQYLFKEVEFLL